MRRQEGDFLFISFLSAGMDCPRKVCVILARVATATASFSQTNGAKPEQFNVAVFSLSQQFSTGVSSLPVVTADYSGDAEREPNINTVLTDNDLRAVLSKLKQPRDRDVCGLVCKRWQSIQDGERRSMQLRAGPLMLERMAARFSYLTDLDMSEIVSCSFHPGWKDADLNLVAHSFRCLERLDLRSCKGITDKGLLKIGEYLPSLQWLDVSDCKQVSDVGMEGVAKGCPNLRNLYLSSCKLITNKSLAALSKCHNLDTLVCRGCVNIDDDGLLSLSEGCSSLQVLDLSKCPKVGDSGVTSITHACSATLHSLILEDCPKVGDAGICAVGECCGSLRILLLGGCRLLSDLALDFYSQKYTNYLTTLQLEHCMKLTDNGIQTIFANCQSLESLDLRCCSSLTDRCVETLSRGQNCLRELKISGCTGFTSEVVSKLAESCPRLTLLEAKYCDHITIHTILGIAFPDGCKVILDTKVSLLF